MEDVNCWKLKFSSCQCSDKLLDSLNLLNTKVRCPIDLNEVAKAIYYAKKYHGSQMRESGDPYYSHPLEVAYLFAEYARKNEQYYKTDLVVTAILHDCIEDTKLTKEMISTIFNRAVASKVEDLTRIKFDKKITAGETVNLLFLQHKNDLLNIKLFDRFHNMSTISSMKPEKVQKIVEETMLYFLPLASYLGIYEIKKKLTKLCCDNLVFTPSSRQVQRHWSTCRLGKIHFFSPIL